jgi:aspartyl-tRNA(Asn)/glutamyl-tRNA(Gln) amidotransferase subunit B
MRRKESADDYMYFPEPDLVPMAPAAEWVEEIRATMPELPAARCARFIEEYQLPEYDAGVLTESRSIADYFEQVAKACKDPKAASNWVMGSVMATLNERGMGMEEFPVPAGHLAELIGAVQRGVISNSIAKQVYARMVETGEAPETIIARDGLTQISDTGELERLVREAVAANPKAVADLRAGKEKAAGAIVGHVMKATRGQANPQLVNELLRRVLAE